MRTISIQLAAAILLAAALCSCATRNTGYKISEETVAFIQPGATTRSDIVENLGPPLFELKEPHVVAYSWGKVRGVATKPIAQEQGFQSGAVAPGGMPYGAGSYSSNQGPSPWEDNSETTEARRWIYCVALDRNDHVTRHGKFELKGAASLENAVRQWAAAGQ